jgi:hypothetical protein
VLLDSGLCDGLIIFLEKPYRVSCVSLRVIQKPQQCGGLGLGRAAAPQKGHELAVNFPAGKADVSTDVRHHNIQQTNGLRRRRQIRSR